MRLWDDHEIVEQFMQVIPQRGLCSKGDLANEGWPRVPPNTFSDDLAAAYRADGHVWHGNRTAKDDDRTSTQRLSHFYVKKLGM